MKAKEVLIVLCALLLAFTGVVGCDGYVSSYRLMPSPKNETSFFQSYNPEQVLRKFRDEQEGGHSDSDGQGSSNGIKTILQHRMFMPRFTMQADLENSLLSALREDILLHLRGMTIAAVHDDAGGGFTYKYISGNSVGNISVTAPVHTPATRRYPVPSGLDDVSLNIAIEETWTRPASETRWWMSMAD